MRTISTIIISIVFLGCNTSKVTNSEREVKTVLGSWEFVSTEVLNPYAKPDDAVFQPKNDSTFNMMQFIGAETINNLHGTEIEFMSNNQVNWDILKNKGSKELNLEYNFDYKDSLLTFSILITKDSKKVYIPTKTTLQDSSMIWNIENFMEIKLKRLN